MYFYEINMTNMTPEKTLLTVVFFMLIGPFFWTSLILQVISRKNFQLTVYKFKTDALRLDCFNNLTRSFINTVINPVQNFLKRFIKTKFMIYHYFCCWIEINWSKFNFSLRLVFFFNSTFSFIWYLKPFVSSRSSLNK